MVSLEIPVAWGDMDALGHVNNVQYFRYFESARIRYFQELGLSVTTEEPGGAPILAQATCEFLFPVVFPDTLRAEASVTRMGNSSATMEYRVVSLKTGKEAARGTSVIVWYDYATAKSIPIPGPMRARIDALEGRA